MEIIYNAKLFVETIHNIKYLHEDAILLGQKKQDIFYGLGYNSKSLLGNILYYLLIVLFPIIFILCVFIQSIRSCLYISFTKKRQLLDVEYFIASANFSKSINKRVNKHIENACWFLNADVKANNYHIIGENYISCYQVISFIDIILSVFSSFIAYIVICRKFGFYYMLYSINAYDWLLFRNACRKISPQSSIFTINHKDRWAFLEDHIVCKQKTLIQHGTEISNCSEEIAQLRDVFPVPGGGWTQNMPKKIETVTRVIAFSEQEVSALKLSIIGCTPEFFVTGYEFETYPLNTNKFTILIIAHSNLYLEKEIEIIENLQDLPIALYVKNHPTQSNKVYHNLCEKYNFTLLTEQRFPKVDLVVTYDSTLAHEYMSVGIDVIYHTHNSMNEIRKHIVRMFQNE